MKYMNTREDARVYGVTHTSQQEIMTTGKQCKYTLLI